MSSLLCGVYGLFESASGDCLYIGQSRDIVSRHKSHLKNLKNGTHKRKDFIEWYSVQKDTSSCIDFRVLEECGPEDYVLNALEIKWFNTYSPRYYGAVPSLNNTWTHSDETKSKIRTTLIGTLRASKSPDFVRSVEIDHICKRCGIIFNTARKRTPDFCSRSCSISYKSEEVHKIDESVCKSYLSGLSLRECGAIYGVSYVTIQKILVSHNIDRRFR